MQGPGLCAPQFLTLKTLSRPVSLRRAGSMNYPFPSRARKRKKPQLLELTRLTHPYTVPDGSTIPEPMLEAIDRFTILLDEIRNSVEKITHQRGFTRIAHLGRNERTLSSIKLRLNDVYTDFRVASSLRLEVQQQQTKVTLVALGTNVHSANTKIEKINTTLISFNDVVAEVSSTMKSNAAAQYQVLFHCRLVVFLA
ncbi:hypothetical protein DFH09DRAFT_1281094 [Mycena vulgaris]|nr:hypothetical protein DFH09DRAFT_1281094 [Mycena vulgaris]